MYAVCVCMYVSRADFQRIRAIRRKAKMNEEEMKKIARGLAACSRRETRFSRPAFSAKSDRLSGVAIGLDATCDGNEKLKTKNKERKGKLI